jgi:hypothetical protein
MKTVASELQQIVTDFAEKINQIPADDFDAKPAPNKWSKKEITGHLIDSAHTNLRRFITAQYEVTPPHLVYQQNFWVDANQYQSSKKEDVILLWKLMNERIVAVLLSMSAENYTRECHTGELHTLEWLAADYVRHLKHHLNQIIPASFV